MIPRPPRTLRSQYGFTLLELLTALAVLAIVAGLVISQAGRLRASAQSTACLGNLRQIGAGLQIYLSENNGRFPELALGPSTDDDENRPALNDYLLDYTGQDPTIFRCPSDRNLFTETGSSYHWNILLNNQMLVNIEILGQNYGPGRIPVVFDADSFHRRSGRSVNYLFADGTADRKTRFHTE